MKLINKDLNKLAIEFSSDELEILDRVIEVPLSAFGLNELLAKTGLSLDKIKDIKRVIEIVMKENLLILTISIIDYVNLRNIFKISCEIVDKNEMHALTAFTWEDALKMQKSLDSIKN